MADPFSITAGVVGITGVALDSLKKLLDSIDAIKTAPRLIADLKKELELVNDILSSFENALGIKVSLPTCAVRISKLPLP